MRDYFKSKFDYHWDMSGGWRFIAAPENISLNQQKLIPREQTPKQLPGNPRCTPTLAHTIYETIFHLMATGESLLRVTDYIGRPPVSMLNQRPEVSLSIHPTKHLSILRLSKTIYGPLTDCEPS
jgi:hypothetical protein